MKFSLVLAALAASAAAFPAMMDANPEVLERAAKLVSRQEFDPTQDPIGVSKAQTNCGPTPCLTFNEEDQLVSITGEHAYVSPAPDEIRGPCPGLNAAANHGYLPRSGIVSLEETVSGLGAGKPRPCTFECFA